jgi:hypothetical protein
LTRDRSSALAAWLVGAAVALPGVAAAQSFTAQPQYYLLSAEATDARALWVQPAGLVARRESSVSLMATVDRVGGSSALGQYGITLASGPLGVGWQHDRLSDGSNGDAFAVGYAFGLVGRAVGVDHRWHRGTNTKSGAWDIGGRYAPLPYLMLSLAWRDIGSPLIRDTTLRATLVPGASVSLLNSRLELAADWELVTHDWGTSAVRGGAVLSLSARAALMLRAEFANTFSARSLAVAFSWNAPLARVTGFGTSLRQQNVEHFGMWGSAVSALQTGRWRGR